MFRKSLLLSGQCMEAICHYILSERADNAGSINMQSTNSWTERAKKHSKWKKQAAMRWSN